MATVRLIVLDQARGAHRNVEPTDVIVDGDDNPIHISPNIDEVLEVGDDANSRNILNLGKVVVGAAAPLTNQGDVQLLSSGVLALKETTTPTADADHGKVYCKNDNQLYFQDGAGTEHFVTLDAAGGDFSDGGDVAGANRTLGNTDAYSLGFLTNNVARISIAAGGAVTVTGNLIASGDITLGNTGFITTTGGSVGIEFDNAGGSTTVTGDLKMSGGDVLIDTNGIGRDASVLTFATGSAGDATFGGNIILSGGTRYIGLGTGTTSNVTFEGASGIEFYGYSAVASSFNFTNLAGAECRMLLSSNGAGDVLVRMATDSISWTYGVDDSDSNKFKVSYSTALATNDQISITPSTTTKPVLDIKKWGVDINMEESDTGILFVENDYNGSSASTVVTIQVPTVSTTGDPRLRFVIEGSTTWTVGVDNDDADTFKIQDALNLVANADFEIETGGRVNINQGALVLRGPQSMNVNTQSSEPGSPSPLLHDIYLDDGTNTASTNPGWRRYNGASWEDIGAIGGGGGGGDFSDGGEAGGANRTLGNTDSYSLGFLTYNQVRLSIAAAGNITATCATMRTQDSSQPTVEVYQSSSYTTCSISADSSNGYCGTTSSHPFYLRANSTDGMYIDTSGYVFIVNGMGQDINMQNYGLTNANSLHVNNGSEVGVNGYGRWVFGTSNIAINGGDLHLSANGLGRDASVLTFATGSGGAATFGGPILAPNGSLSAPSFALSSDTDTGWYGSTGQFNIVTAGAVRINVTTSQVSVQTSSGLTCTNTVEVTGSYTTKFSIDYNASTITLELACSSGKAVLQTTSSQDMEIGANSTSYLFVDTNGNVIVGAKSQLSYTATDGFLYIPEIDDSSSPSGTPTSVTGKVPMCYGLTSDAIYVYNGGSWVSVSLA